ncbi:hypothetical protein [Paenibacillus sp. sgz500958]|uniref:HNH endonuclease n=1 Tax=Paenibacillus sp. sgz500958 TaxID=3242475 RepID=UPI0036D24DD6
MNASYIIKKLEKAYPDKIIQSFAEQHASLYQLTGAFSRQNDTTIKDFLDSNGFEYITKPRGIPSTFDAVTARRLIEQFDVTQMDFAVWFKVSKQAISQKLNRTYTGVSWTSTNLSPDEEEVIDDMIERNIFTYEDEELIVAIRSNFIQACIIIIRSEKTKVLFEFNQPLSEKLGKANYDIFREIDFSLRESMIPVNIFGIKNAKIDDRAALARINQQCRKRGITTDEYCVMHGFEGGYCRSNMQTDEDLIEILNSYVTQDNLVYFPHTVNEYFKLTNKASRANMTLEELFEFFGYIKVDSRLDSNYKNKISRYIDELKQLLVRDSQNKILLRTETALYQRLYTFAKRRGSTLDEFLAELGFERVYERVVTFDSEKRSSDTNRHPKDKSVLVRELEGLQGHLERSVTQNEAISRSRQLVNKLKELYDYRCQLCDPFNGYPVIEKEDGTFYVEVHHIIALQHASLLPNGYDDQLDTFRNAIVVCPFHHKVLHYHQGGFERLINQNGEIFFVSKLDALLKVLVNYHLQVDERGSHLLIKS